MVQLWDNGIKFSVKPPNCGMKLVKFVDSLRTLYESLPGNNHCRMVYVMYTETVASELMPYWRNKIRRKEKYRY